jgi:beta-lactamase regulating signal transducer with metallopeptidase domain
MKKLELLTVCDQWVAAALNGLYQGIIIAVLVALGLRLLRRTNAATRHAVWLSTLLLLALLIPAHGLRNYISNGPAAASEPEPARVFSAVETDLTTVQSGESFTSSRDETQNPRFEISPAGSPAPAVLREPESDLVGREPVLVQVTQTRRVTPADGFHQAVLLQMSDDEASSAILPPVSAAISETEDNPTASRLGWLAKRLVNPVSWNFRIGSGSWRAASVCLVGCWLIIAALNLSLLALRLYRIRVLKRQALPPGLQLHEMFEALCTRLAPKRKVALKISQAHRSAIVLGFVHPAILLPAETRVEEAEQVLRHELAHVSRRDDWANLVQHFIQAILFFHPAAWWISRQLSLQREIACDDQVLKQGARPRAYALLLANLAGRMQGSHPLLAPGASTNKSQLEQRIDMILNPKRNASPDLARTRLGFIASAAALLAVVAIYSAPRIVLAQNEPPPAEVGGSIIAAPSGGALVGPGAPDSDSAEVPAPPGIAPGPKLKPGPAIALNVHPNIPPVAALPAPAALPPLPALPGSPYVPKAITVAPVPPAPVAIAQDEPRAPRSARPGRRASSDSSMEERIERLEKMVESLLAAQGPKPGQPQFHLKGPDVKIDVKELERMKELDKKRVEIDRQQMIKPREIEQIKERAKRDAARAVEDAKRATKEHERLTRIEPKRQARERVREGHQQQLEALRKALEHLEREKEKLSRQIEQLERSQDSLEEQLDQLDELNEELDLSFEFESGQAPEDCLPKPLPAR